MIRQVCEPVVPKALVNGDIIYHVNPTGRFVVGGPVGDCGLTGRKIIVDTYGGMGRHGGGAFSGKDPSKVDRSATYMARYMAKNVVAAGLAAKCEVQLAYAIGVARPVSINVTTFGTGALGDVTMVTSRAFMNRLVAIDNYKRTDDPSTISPMVTSSRTRGVAIMASKVFW